jgi:acetolactate synthase-1/2/3 large subunit
MTRIGGDIIAEILKSHQIPFVFTLCGGHISPILVGAKTQGIRVIDVRDEVTAVYAADAFARITGIPGIAVVTAGPGVTNTITAMKNAQMAQSPLILLGGAAATVIKGRGSLQDIDQISLLQSIVKQAVTINQNCDIVPVLEHAFQVAQSDTPGPVFVECPIDLLYSEQLVREWYGIKSDPSGNSGLKSKLFQFYLDRHVNRMFACDFDAMTPAPKTITLPDLKPDRVEKAAQLLAKSSQPVLIVGSQTMLCQTQTDALQVTIETLGLPVYLTGMARGLMGKDHPLQMRHHRGEALKEADLVLLAGMPCDFRLGYGRSINGKATLMAVNRDKTDLNLNRKPDLGILADPFTFLCSLSEFDRHQPERFRPWLKKLQERDGERNLQITKQANTGSGLINPLRFFQELDRFIGEDSMIIADGGDFVATASYILRPRTPLSWLDPGVFGTLGVGAGFAMGAKLAKPGHEVWLIYGDGAAGYSLQEIDSMVRHGLPVIAVVGNDGSWAQIARDQVEILHDDVATVLRKTDYHKVAEGFGAKGLLLDRSENILSVLQQARETARSGIPVLINVLLEKSDFRKGSISM